MALKCAVVGMGGIGETHATCYKENPLAELVAVCDLVREKADAAAAFPSNLPLTISYPPESGVRLQPLLPFIQNERPEKTGL